MKLITDSRVSKALGAAEAYLARGFEVVPLRDGTKYPPVKGTTGRDGVALSWEEIAALIRRGRVNIALRLPRGVIGIDVDQHDGKHGADNLVKAGIEDLPWEAGTWRSSSRHGDNRHGVYLFRAPHRQKYSNPVPDVEVIHYGWRYAVVWPSVVEGRAYSWWPPNGCGPIPSIGFLPWLGGGEGE